MEFDLDKACAMYFEQAVRNEKAIADLRKAHKSDKENLKDEIENGFRNPFAYALGEISSKDAAEALAAEIKRRLEE
jgi:phage-related tail protein